MTRSQVKGGNLVRTQQNNSIRTKSCNSALASKSKEAKLLFLKISPPPEKKKKKKKKSHFGCC